MSYHLDDTIVAIASAQGGAARGIVRISGPQTIECLQKCFVGALLEEHRRATVLEGFVRAASPVGEIPCDLYFWPTSKSYTRQPAAEIHTFGSPPLLNAVVGAVCLAGARLAEPGEFTLRAFLAQRIDLPQAEAVLGVIDADNDKRLQSALSQLAGGVFQPLHQLRDKLLDLLARLEAGLDFVEEDIEFISSEQTQQQLSAAAAQVQSLIVQLSARGDATNLPKVAILGAPNAGKSSLLNALAREESALVSPIAGTTRDFVAARVALADIACLLIDTAGVDEPTSETGSESSREATRASLASISWAAQQMTRRQAEQADLQIWCFDATRPLADWEREEIRPPQSKTRLFVWTKTDMASPQWQNDCEDRKFVKTSVVTGEGLSELQQAIADALSSDGESEVIPNPITTTSVRCEECLRLAEAALLQGCDVAAAQQGDELVAAEVRIALDELGKVVGAVYTDDVLDRIFGQFCIGK